MTALTARNERLAALARAVLVLEWPQALSTRAVEERISRRYDPDVYRALCRLERLGEAEKITPPDLRSRYWRLAEAPESRQ